MPAHKSIHSTGDVIRRHVLLRLLPRLAELPSVRWESGLQRARAIDFDAFERVAMVAGVTAVAYWLDIAPDDASPMEWFLRYVLVFFEALPFLGIVIGPVYLRRIRRGLDEEIAVYRTTSRKETRHEPDSQ